MPQKLMASIPSFHIFLQYYSLTSFSAESGNPAKNTEEKSAAETSPNKLIVYMEEITQ